MISTNAVADTKLLQALYTAREGSDPEYAQGAIERNELPHREVTRFVFVIRVDASGTCDEWQTRLNAAVDPKFGSFSVAPATPEQEEGVRSGTIRLQQ